MLRRLLVAACAFGLGACAGPDLTKTDESTTTTASASATGFVAFGDFGGGAAQDDVAAAMTRYASDHTVDALVTTGDNVYQTGDPSLFAAYLDAPYAELRATRPMWVTLGNHDVIAGHGAEQLQYLGLPSLPYTRDLGDLQLIFLDANNPDQAQAQWLDRTLSQAGPRFRIVVFHQPAYSCATHGSTAAVDANWVPVLNAHRVPLVLNGHDHYYERFHKAVFDVTYVVTGGGGQGLYNERVPCNGVPTREHSEMTHHFVAVRVQGNTLRLEAVRSDGTVIDHATIKR